MSIVVRAVQRNEPYATSDEGEEARFRGHLYAVPASGTYSFDERLDEAVRLSGGVYWVTGATLGDKATLSIVDKDDILGLGPGYVVATYANEIPLAPWDHTVDLTAPTAAKLPAGLYLRLTVVTASASMAMGVTYRMFVEGSP